MAWFFQSWLGRALAALGGLIVAIIAAFTLGRREGRLDAEAAELGRYQESRKDMDHADVSRGDPAGDLDWLRRRAER